MSVLVKVTPQEYEEMNKKIQPKPKLIRNCAMAFVVGGGICLVAQILINVFLYLGIALKEAQILGTTSMIFLGSLLTGLGLYDSIVSLGGAGGILPVTGFANAMVSPAMDSKKDGYILGVGAKMFSVAGPVIICGTIVAFVMGLGCLIFR
ncbi:MAG: SpoVA/SpoVAEb family sporulation membrane protein [Peptococcaceae bacterium]|nr:SpoVA/SpoVAEb family sporulation membrane protein [Peptococcaceae bacterium]